MSDMIKQDATQAELEELYHNTISALERDFPQAMANIAAVCGPPPPLPDNVTLEIVADTLRMLIEICLREDEGE